LPNYGIEQKSGVSQPSPNQPLKNRVSWPLIAAGAFLAVSLVGAALVIGGVDLSTLIPGPANPPNVPATAALPAATAISTVPGVQATTPSPTQPHDIIALVPPQGDTSDLAARLPDAIRRALQGSPLAKQVQFETSQAGTSHSDLVVAWAQADGGLLTLTVHSPFEPAPASVESVLAPYSVVGPQSTPVVVDPKSDLALSAGLIAGFLELAGQPDAGTLARIQALQALPSGLAPDKQAANQAVILFAIAQAQAALSDPTAALETYSQALRLQADFPVATLNRGSVYLTLGDSAAAQAAFDTVKDAAAAQAVVQYNQAIASLPVGDLDAALKAADRLAGANPSAAWGVDLRGVIHYKRGEYEAALSDFMKAADLAPHTPAILFNQARTLTALQRYPEALDAYRTLLALEPDNPLVYFQQAMTYKANGNLSEAQAGLSQAILLNDKYLDAYLERARLELQSKAYDKALDDAGRVLTLDPNNGPAYQISGDSLLAQENWIKAEKAYSAAADNGVSNADLFAGRGWAHHRQREIDSAISDYRQAISLGDKDTILLLRLGFALLDVNQKKGALDALLGAVNGGLNTAESHAALALALDINFRESEANQEYQQAVALDPRYADRKFLSNQPLWTSITIGRARAIAKRLK
jgi:tetratricopeptide (TPR) repeat protein